jgi:hypothetical protein
MSPIENRRDGCESAHLARIVDMEAANAPIATGSALNIRDASLTPAAMSWSEILMLMSSQSDASIAPPDRDSEDVIVSPDWYWKGIEIPISLYLTVVFILSVWTLAALALAIGASGEIILATMAMGTAGAAVEWMAHR